MLLANDVAHVTTIEYAKTVLSPGSAHPKETEAELQARWAWRHPSDVARAYLDGSWRQVDVAFSYSSLEHDGLGTVTIQAHSRPHAPSATRPRPTPSFPCWRAGRYGDPLNPEGDLESIQKVAPRIHVSTRPRVRLPTCPRDLT